MGESDETGEVCVEIVTGYTIARSIPFRIQSLLSNDTTAEGITENSCFLSLHGIYHLCRGGFY